MFRWGWSNDQKGITYYNEGVSLHIEQAFQDGQPKTDLDSERFIDLKDMFQRRLDDPSKRRAIQREPGVVFANKTFVLAPDVEQRDTLVTMIAGCEDTMILKRLHKSVNMLVVAAATPFSSKMVLEAHQLGIPVIPSTVMLDAVKSGSFKPTKADMIDTEKAAIEASKAKRLREEEEARKAQAEASKMEEEERKRRKLEEQEKKRKEEEEKKLEEEKKRKIAAEEEKKKLEEKKKSEEKKKLEEKKKAEEKKRAEEYERRAQDEKKRQRQYEDEEIAVSKKATNKSSNSSISKAETTVAPPSKVQEESESDTPKIEDSKTKNKTKQNKSIASMFEEGSEWTGVVDDVAFVLTVSHASNGLFGGFVSYPSLGSAKLGVVGKIDGCFVEYSEESCLFSDDFVASGSCYKLKMTSVTSAEGTCTSLDHTVSKVALRLARPPTRLDVQPKVMRGFVLQPVPFEVHISNVSAGKASGSVLFNGSVTKFSAPLNGRQIVVDGKFSLHLDGDFASGVLFDKNVHNNKLFFLRE